MFKQYCKRHSFGLCKLKPHYTHKRIRQTDKRTNGIVRCLGRLSHSGQVRLSCLFVRVMWFELNGLKTCDAIIALLTASKVRSSDEKLTIIDDTKTSNMKDCSQSQEHNWRYTCTCTLCPEKSKPLNTSP